MNLKSMFFFNLTQSKLFWIILILFCGLLLRLSIINTRIIEDEGKNVILADEISFNPQNLNLPIENSDTDHPLLNIYFTKLGILLFGKSAIGIRFFHLLFGILTLIVFYFIGRNYGKKEGLIALFLIAFNQFHIHTSIRAENNSLLFFLTSLSILIFWHSFERKNKKLFLLLGPICALAFLTKAESIILFVAFIIYILRSPKKHFWLTAKELYFSISLFLLLVSPLIFWMTFHKTSQLAFQPSMYTIANLRPRLTSINFYLIELFAWIQNIDYKLLVSWEYSILDSLTGIFLLIGVTFSLQKSKNNLTTLLLIIFVCYMIPLSFFALPREDYGEFWWASSSLIPAICLFASIVTSPILKKKFIKIVLISFGIYSIMNSISFVKTLDASIAYPPRRQASFVDDNLVIAEIYTRRQMWDEAIIEMRRLLQLSPNDVINHSLLGWLYFQKGEIKQALTHWYKSQEILPTYRSKYNLLFDISPKIIEQSTIYFPNMTDDDLYHLGILHYYNNQFEESLRFLNKTSSLKSKLHLIYMYKGRVHMKTEKYMKAIEFFLKSIELNSKNELAYFLISHCQLNLNDLNNAEIFLKEAILINPDNAEFHDQLGNIYLQQGKRKESKKEFREAENIRLLI